MESRFGDLGDRAFIKDWNWRGASPRSQKPEGLYALESTSMIQSTNMFLLWTLETLYQTYQFLCPDLHFFLYSTAAQQHGLSCVFGEIWATIFAKLFTRSQSLLNCNPLRLAALWTHFVKHFLTSITGVWKIEALSNNIEGCCSIPKLLFWYTLDFQYRCYQVAALTLEMCCNGVISCLPNTFWLFYWLKRLFI